MNEKNTNQLLKKYPEIFAQHKLSMKETAMCWGIETGNGWFDIIDNLCYLIEEHKRNEELNGREPPKIEATQLKEKKGGLRFYADYTNDFVDGLIRFAERISYEICENCGSTENVSQTEGWIYTLCEKCHKKRNKNVEGSSSG